MSANLKHLYVKDYQNKSSAIMLMSPQRLWLPTQGLQDGALQHSIIGGGGAHEAPPILEEFLAVNGCLG